MLPFDEVDAKLRPLVWPTVVTMVRTSGTSERTIASASSSLAWLISMVLLDGKYRLT